MKRMLLALVSLVIAASLFAVTGLLAVEPSASFAQDGRTSVEFPNTSPVSAYDLHVEVTYFKETPPGSGFREATPVVSLGVSVSGLPAGWGATPPPGGGQATFTSDRTTGTPHTGTPVNSGDSVTIYVQSTPPPEQVYCYWTWASGVMIGGSDRSFLVTPTIDPPLSTPASSTWSLVLTAIAALGVMLTFRRWGRTPAT